MPFRNNVPSGVVRQQTHFGDVTGYGAINGEYFFLRSGVVIAPLLKAANDPCQCPHWGYVLRDEFSGT